jgi:hypothetical protein
LVFWTAGLRGEVLEVFEFGSFFHSNS